MLLAAAREAVSNSPALPSQRTMVLAAMGCDPEVCRYGARWRLAERLTGPALQTQRDQIIDPLDAAGVVGNMPNIPANRLNSQFDLQGPSFTVECRGAVRWPRSGHRSAGLGCERDRRGAGRSDRPLGGARAHGSARGLGCSRTPADAAVMLTLMRLEDATAQQVPVLAILDDRPGGCGLRRRRPIHRRTVLGTPTRRRLWSMWLQRSSSEPMRQSPRAP